MRFIGNHYADDDGNLHKSTSKHSVFGGTDEGAPVSNIVNLTFERDSEGKSNIEGEWSVFFRKLCFCKLQTAGFCDNACGNNTDYLGGRVIC